LRLSAAKLGKPYGAFSLDERLQPLPQHCRAIKTARHFGRLGEQIIISVTVVCIRASIPNIESSTI